MCMSILPQKLLNQDAAYTVPQSRIHGSRVVVLLLCDIGKYLSCADVQ